MKILLLNIIFLNLAMANPYAVRPNPTRKVSWKISMRGDTDSPALDMAKKLMKKQAYEIYCGDQNIIEFKCVSDCDDTELTQSYKASCKGKFSDKYKFFISSYEMKTAITIALSHCTQRNMKMSGSNFDVKNVLYFNCK